MLFAYSYMTSDGMRHADEIDAPSRDEAYAELRRRGIRAIRVEAKETNGKGRLLWFAIVVILFAVCVAVGVSSWFVAYGRYRNGTRSIFVDLQSKADAIRTQYESSIKLLDLKVLEDYSLLARHNNLSSVTNEIRKAKEVLSLARAQAGDLFSGVLEMFPPESVNERIDAQKMYGELMNGIDATEGRIRQDERALTLLDSSRDKWRVAEDGRLVFSDARLRMEIEFFSRDKDDATARWKKDFGNAGRKETNR